MSDTDYDIDDFEDNSPAGLRKALKKAQDEAKKARDELAAEKAARAAAEKTAKKSTLTDILRDKGVKPGLARFIEQDDVEATPEAVGKWLDENGEFFNVKPAEQQAEQQENDEQEQVAPEGDALPDDLVNALQLSREIDNVGISQSEVGTMQRVAGLSTDPSKTSYEDLVAELKAAGAPLA